MPLPTLDPKLGQPDEFRELPIRLTADPELISASTAVARRPLQAPGPLLHLISTALPRSRLLWRSLLTLAVLPGCGDTPYCTIATYATPGSGLTLWIAAQGTVPSGADLGDVASGLVRFCPTRATGAALDLHLSSPGASDVSADPAVLGRRLCAAGFVVDPSEVEEMGLVLAGALAGPKGPRMEGQPSALSVSDVAPRYERCTLPAPTCPPRPNP